jgi:hypothetical protein
VAARFEQLGLFGEYLVFAAGLLIKVVYDQDVH